MTLGQPYITKFVAGLVIGLGTVAGLFAVASAAASSLSGSFASAESVSHQRNVDFEAAHAETKFHARQPRRTRPTGKS
jgi:hypothetical protein